MSERNELMPTALSLERGGDPGTPRPSRLGGACNGRRRPAACAREHRSRPDSVFRAQRLDPTASCVAESDARIVRCIAPQSDAPERQHRITGHGSSWRRPSGISHHEQDRLLRVRIGGLPELDRVPLWIRRRGESAVRVDLGVDVHDDAGGAQLLNHGVQIDDAEVDRPALGWTLEVVGHPMASRRRRSARLPVAGTKENPTDPGHLRHGSPPVGHQHPPGNRTTSHCRSQRCAAIQPQ